MSNYYRQQFLVRFSYIGSRFHGVDEQPFLKTVLGTLRKRIEQAARQKANVLTVSARTDKGVHALMNVATFYLRIPVDISQFIKDVSCDFNDGLYGVKVVPVSNKVHARGISHSKTYRYTIEEKGPFPREKHFTNPFAWQIVPALNTENMIQASRALIGEKDFSSLRGGGCQAGSPIKEIFSIEITRHKNGVILIEIEGRSFLRKMIRNLVGLLVEIGVGFRPPDSIESILEQRRRSAAGIMAPACGLCLVRVDINDIKIEQILNKK